ncbi:MAG: insulinase family protein [Oscillospiraceae bacterium]|jgi:predicted Zn-dependent peptidase|nr:insulinase family protein [Oscillospiraceae bacterium]
MYDKITLPNGVRILTERVSDVRSAALGVWVASGSRHESAEFAGASHFIEHMLFRGTETRPQQRLSEFMAEVGGQINAFTSKDVTCFHGKVIDDRLAELAETLSDMLQNSLFDEDDTDKERNIIIEEIGMFEDTPDDVCEESLAREMYSGALGRGVLGTRKTLSSLTGSRLREYRAKRYGGENIIIALAGSFTDADCGKIASAFSEIPRGKANAAKKSAYTAGFAATERDTEQNHILLAFPAFPAADDKRFAVQMMSDILGGDVSSRLFRELRDNRGLCYNTYSFAQSYADCGGLLIYTALAKEAQDEAVGVIADEIARLADGGVTDAELSRSRQQTTANLLMSLESTSSRMNRLARGELVLGYAPDVSEVIERYAAVTRDEVRDAARGIFDFTRVSLSVVGETDGTADSLNFLRGYK